MADQPFELPTEEQTNAQFEAAGQPGSNPLPVNLGTAPQPTAQEDTHVNVVDPDGELVSIPSHQLHTAVSQGYRQAEEQDIEHYKNKGKYEGPAQTAMAGLEGLASGLTGGLSTGLETATLGVPGATGITTAEDIRGRREEHPIVRGVGEIGSLLVPGSLIGKGMGKAGNIATEAMGLAEPVGYLSKIGSAATKGFIDNAIFQGGDEVSKMLSFDPNQTVESAITDIGLGGLIGAGIGASIPGAVSPLWKATVGGKLGGVLGAISDRLGGIEGATSDALDAAIKKSGVEVPPAVKSALSKNPYIQEVARTLEQTDTNASGLEYQKTLNDFKKNLGDSVAELYGKTAADVLPLSEISAAESGKKIGSVLAEELDSRIGPLSKEYENIAKRYESLELPASVSEGGKTGSAKISEEVGQLAQKEGWLASPSSDIMRQVNHVLTELPLQKSVKDISNYVQRLSEVQRKNPLDRSFARQVGMLKGIFQKAEGEAIATHLGVDAGAEAAEKFKQLRKAYAQESQIKNALDERLHTRGSTSGYAKSVREMAATDGESLVRRLSGKGDANLLEILNKEFPRTAQAVRDFHVDQLLAKAKDGEGISSAKLIQNLEKMSPELQAFTTSPEAREQIKAVDELLSGLKNPHYNHSNTARTADKLLGDLPSSAIGLAAAMHGHNPIVSALYGMLAKYIGKTAPDAMRLALLKFLGSSQPIESEGFKKMFDLFHSALKGEASINKAAKNVFKAAVPVLPQGLLPSDSDREKLDKKLKNFRDKPDSMFDVGGKTGHYLPDHATAIGSTAGNAIQYLNALRPSSDPQNPLDKRIEPSPMQKSAYNRALDIAQQPLIVLDKIQKGTLTPQDTAALKALYPNLYNRLVQKLSSEMVDAVSKDTIIPYGARMSLSLFLGQPLDGTMTPQAIMAAQPQSGQNQPQNSPQQPQQRQKHSMTALNKLPGMYKTPGQGAEEDKASRS